MAFTVETARLAGQRSVAAREQRKLKRRLNVLGSSFELSDMKNQPIEKVRSSIEQESKSYAESKLHQYLSSESKSDIPMVQRLKILVETGDKLYGWSKRESPTTLVQVNYMDSMKRKADVVQRAQHDVET